MFDQLKNGQARSLSEIDEVRGQLHQAQEKLGKFSKQIDKFQVTFRQLSQIDHEAELNNLQRKQIKSVVVELLTPFKQATNVDLKAMKKFLGEVRNQAENQKADHASLQRSIDEMSVTLVKGMKLENQEKISLEKELLRLQQIDRIKHASSTRTPSRSCRASTPAT